MSEKPQLTYLRPHPLGGTMGTPVLDKPEDKKRAAAWRFGWTVFLSAAAAGLTAVITDPASVNTFLNGELTPQFWRTAMLIFISGALMALKKYFNVKLPAPPTNDTPA